MSWSGRSTIVVIAVCAALGVVCASAAAAPTPLPHVTGPIPVTATSYPFGAADHTLVKRSVGACLGQRRNDRRIAVARPGGKAERAAAIAARRDAAFP